MRRHANAFMCMVVIFLVIAPFAYASSTQAYQDYQFQFDRYRLRFSEYQVAIKEYKQFNSLASQQDALTKVQSLILQRNQVAKTYFLFLNEKLTENPQLTGTELATYRGMVTNQIAFLDQNSAASQTIITLDDAMQISDRFVKTYKEMQSDYRQIITGLELGYLNYFAKKFDEEAAHAQALIDASRGNVTPEKQATLDRWLLALTNQHSLYEQKALNIKSAISKISGDLQSQERDFIKVQTMLQNARKDIVEGVSFLKEVENALQYE